MYLLDDVGTKLGFGELNNVILKLTYKRCQIHIRFFENVLENIITKLILRQCDCVLDEFCVELFTLLVVCVIDTTLEDAAAMLMSRNFNTIHCNSIINELT